MNKLKIYPTDGELEILQVLWQKGPSTVKDVNAIMSEGKDVGYTTTLKILQIMYSKGLVSRKKSGKFHVYSASVSIEDTRQQAVDKVVNSVFQGSAMKLVMQALGNNKSSKKELAEIREYLETLDKKESEGGRNE